MLVAEKFRTLGSLREASPTRREVTALALDQSQVAPRTPIDACRFCFDQDDVRDAPSGHERGFASGDSLGHGGRHTRPECTLVGRDLRPHNLASNANRIGRALSADDGGSDIAQGLAFRRLKCAVSDGDDAARTVRHGEHDPALSAKSDRVTGKKFAAPIKEDCARWRIINIELVFDP
jgi:hypothetical protein